MISLKDVLKCVKVMHLVQSAMIDGIDLMHKLSVGSCEETIQLVNVDHSFSSPKYFIIYYVP